MFRDFRRGYCRRTNERLDRRDGYADRDGIVFVPCTWYLVPVPGCEATATAIYVN